MTDTTTIHLVFTIMRTSGGKCREADRDRVDRLLSDDGECLALEGFGFDVGDIQWSTPDLLNGNVYVEFVVEVDSYDEEGMSPEGLRRAVFNAAILHLPAGLDVTDLDATLA